jgi:hypothetical protein
MYVHSSRSKLRSSEDECDSNIVLLFFVNTDRPLARASSIERLKMAKQLGTRLILELLGDLIGDSYVEFEKDINLVDFANGYVVCARRYIDYCADKGKVSVEQVSYLIDNSEDLLSHYQSS